MIEKITGTIFLFNIKVILNRSFLKTFGSNIRPAPDKWRIFLEEIVTSIDKRLASIGSLLLFCDYFEVIKDQKTKSHKKVIFWLVEFIRVKL